MLAIDWNRSVHDPVQWLVSEKLDGHRVYWNGTNLLSRNGNILLIPSTQLHESGRYIHRHVQLDGELW